MKIPLDAVKELRNATAASVSDCRKALEDAKGDMKEATVLLRKRGADIAAKKQDRQAKEGRIEAYVHTGNKIGVLVEVNAESDFVARGEDFCNFTKDLAMHITACNPLYVAREDVPAEVLKHEKNKEDYYKAHCLMEQPFVKDPSITIKDCLVNIIAKLGENIVIRRFARYRIGE
ncbi:MAG: elongation factor Ts [Candidatus Omnitrophica bacterium]|nr:elongation factor Ts [Candidatus Omnitrophota bacterium]